MPHDEGRGVRWLRRALRVVVVGGSLAGLVAGYAVVTWHVFATGAPPTGPLAVWHSDGWLAEDWGPGSLGDDLASIGATDLLLHAGATAGSGRPSSRLLRRAPSVLQGLEVAAPEVRVQAWMEVGGAEADLDLRHPADRARLAVVGERLLGLGFDGLHLAGPAPSEGAVLDLLDRLRAVTDAHDAVLSVAVPEIEPLPTLAAVTGALPGGDTAFRTKTSYRRLAARVDQVVLRPAVPRLPTVWLDGSLTRRVVTRAAETLGAGRASLLVGVVGRGEATSPESARRHLESRLRGIRQGLSRANGRPRHVGLAVPAATLEDDDQRRALHSMWITPSRQ